jgi:anti-sigma factor RsiW
MAHVGSPVVCDRIRSQISVGLDDELSQLERAMIASHVERCAPCRDYESGLIAVTDALRSTPLEPMGRAISVRRQRQLVVRGRLQVVAAAAAVAAVALFAAAELSGPDALDLDPALAPSRTQVKYESPRQVEIEQALLERAEPGRPNDIRGLVL